MLQCSKYKAHFSAEPAYSAFSRPVYHGSGFRGAPAAAGRFQSMDHTSEAYDLRSLLSVARKLRHLADDTPADADRDLYVTAAAALETRARWLATHLPGDRCPDAGAHHRVDLLV